MELRSGQVTGAHGQLPAELRPAFEEGVRLLFRRWTALTLAVENQWGGPTSADKANWLLEESINWFYRNKEHYWDDLEEELDDALLQDFNVEAEDGSPAEVAKSLCALHAELLRGEMTTLQHLQAQAAATPSGAAHSKRQVVDHDGTVMGEGSDDDSSDDDDDAMDEDMAPQALPLQQQQDRAPVIDEDGFQLVQTKSKGRGRR